MNEFGDQVQFVGVAGRAGSFEDYQLFVGDLGLAGIPHVVDPDGSLWAELGVRGQPSWLFVNDDGSTESVPTALGLERLRDQTAALINR